MNFRVYRYRGYEKNSQLSGDYLINHVKDPYEKKTRIQWKVRPCFFVKSSKFTKFTTKNIQKRHGPKGSEKWPWVFVDSRVLEGRDLERGGTSVHH